MGDVGYLLLLHALGALSSRARKLKDLDLARLMTECVCLCPASAANFLFFFPELAENLGLIGYGLPRVTQSDALAEIPPGSGLISNLCISTYNILYITQKMRHQNTK